MRDTISQTRLDEEAAKKLQDEFDKEESIARGKAKKEERANITLIETWDDIQAKIDSTFLDDAVYTDLHVGREEVSSYTTYTFNDAGKEASN
nr:hypothetical protein [Tanacetum cinerariifolium]